MNQLFQEKINRLIRKDANPEQFIIEYYDELKWRVDTHYTQLNDECVSEEWLYYIDYLEESHKILTENLKEKPFFSFKTELVGLEENLE